jgi:Rrf2 family protein
MKFSAQEEYGLRCILSLARTEAQPSVAGGAPPEPRWLTTHDIAQREGLSLQYTGKLIRILGRAGLVESVRGRKGGYRLTRPAGEISVAETLAALGGKIYEAGTCDRYKGDRKFCVHTNDCSIRSLWSGLHIMIDGVLSRTTLRDLITSEGTMAQHVGKYSAIVESFPETLARRGGAVTLPRRGGAEEARPAAAPLEAIRSGEPGERLGASE